MPYYISEYVGGGTRQNPYMPVGLDQPGAAAIDLRPNPTVLTGRALLWTPTPNTDARLILVSDAKITRLSTAVRNRIKNTLGVNFSETQWDQIAGRIMLSPPTNGWKPLQAVRANMRYEVWLGDLLFSKAAQLGPQGELIDPSDNFNRANENPLAGSWTRLSGGSGNAKLESNAITSATSGDKFYYYAGAVATADQFSQVLIASSAGSQDFGAATRIGSNGFSGYVAATYTGDSTRNIFKYVAGSFSILAITPGAPAVSDVIRCEAEGSTIRYLQNGSLVQFVTDTSLSSAGNGVGFFHYEAGAILDDWQGGDLGSGAQSVSVSGRGSVAAFGTLVVVKGPVGVSVAGKGSAAAFGSITPRAVVIVPVAGRGSAAAFGAAQALPGNVSVPVTGRGSVAAYGTIGLAVRFQIAGLGSAAAFGAVGASTSGGAQNVPVTGRGSAAAFGSLTPAPGGINVAVAGRGSAAAFGSALRVNQRFAIPGRGSAAAFGAVSVGSGGVVVPISGLGSAANFGAVTFDGGAAPTFNPAVHGGRYR